MKWGIVSKPNVKKTTALTRDVVEFLREKKVEVLLEKECGKALDEKGLTLAQINKQADLVVTLGGDGTILHALAEIDKPLFSINSGGMGFLAEVESKYAIGGISRVLEGNYNVEERAKLRVTVDGKRLQDAANEVTVQTSQIAKICYLQLYVEEELIETMGADGVIIATPTGSTSYALSVGGPMMDPAVHAMVIAPIAPFKLSARPWIVPLEKTIRVKLLPKSKESQIVIDGRHAQTVTPESDMQVTISEKKARFVRFGESFYQMVRLKLVR